MRSYRQHEGEEDDEDSSSNVTQNLQQTQEELLQQQQQQQSSSYRFSVSQLGCLSSNQSMSFSKRYKQDDIRVTPLTINQRLAELNLPKKYAIQGITGNEYSVILCEQPIIPEIDESTAKLTIKVSMLQNASALRGCMRIGIVSKKHMKATDYIMQEFKDHGCFMFSQDSTLLHSTDNEVNRKKVAGFSFHQGDVLQLKYEITTKTLSVENITTNVVHSMKNVNIREPIAPPKASPNNHAIKKTKKSKKKNIGQQYKQKSQLPPVDATTLGYLYDPCNGGEKGGEEAAVGGGQGDNDDDDEDEYMSYSFISSIVSQKDLVSQTRFEYPQFQEANGSDGECYHMFDDDSETDDEEEENSFHFAFMMGLGPSVIEIL